MTRPSLLGGVLVVLALYGVGATYLLLVSRVRADAARRDADAAQMRAAEAVVAERATPRAVAEKAAPLAPQIARVRKAVPRAKVVEALTWRTDPVVVPCPPSAAAPSPPADATTPAKAPEVEIEVRGTEARLETDGGAVAAVGEVEVWSVSPGALGNGPVRLAVKPWRADLTQFVAVDRTAAHRTPRWSAGPVLGRFAGRLKAGVIIAGPELRFGPLVGRPVVVGYPGDVRVLGGALVSW